MKIEYINGVTRISDFEIDKGLQNLERGISLENFFKHEALRFEYGEEAYFDMLVREIEDRDQDGYFDEDWEYFEFRYGIGSREMRNIILELQKKAKPTTPAPANNQLQTKLTDPQRGKLCDLLIENEFIPDTTNKEGFIWAFGGKNDKYTCFSIEWLKNKQLLRELLTPLKSDELKIADVERIVPYIFIKMKKPAKLAKNKPEPSTDSDLLKTIISEAQK